MTETKLSLLMPPPTNKLCYLCNNINSDVSFETLFYNFSSNQQRILASPCYTGASTPYDSNACPPIPKLARYEYNDVTDRELLIQHILEYHKPPNNYIPGQPLSPTHLYLLSLGVLL